MGRGLHGEYLGRLSLGGLFPSRMPAKAEGALTKDGAEGGT